MRDSSLDVDVLNDVCKRRKNSPTKNLEDARECEGETIIRRFFIINNKLHYLGSFFLKATSIKSMYAKYYAFWLSNYIRNDDLPSLPPKSTRNKGGNTFHVITQR